MQTEKKIDKGGRPAEFADPVRVFFTVERPEREALYEMAHVENLPASRLVARLVREYMGKQ